MLATMIGSGIKAERLAGGNTAIALLGSTLPTGALLVVLTLIFAPISGAHFSPAVTLAFALRGEITLPDAFKYVATFGLLATILGLVRNHPETIPYTVGLCIPTAYWFTASTSFTNPAVTIARGFSNTFGWLMTEIEDGG